MTESEIQGVKTAALLHDIGKLAVPEHILSKPGPLTQEEFQKIRIHPQVGAEIIAGVPFPYPVAPLILSHHERWDGKGYPAGMKGEEIPAGARILAVVDYFDALTSERPYHKAMSDEGAIGLLRQEAGKALDPSLVQKFVENLPALRAEAETTVETVRTLQLPTGHEREGPAGCRAAAGAVEQDRVRRHRAGASRNLRAVRDRAGDGHQPGRRRHDGADLVEAQQPGAVLLLRAVPAQRGDGDAALPVRDGRRRRSDSADLGQERPRSDRLGRAQPPHTGQRAPERRPRSGRHLRRRRRCSRRWSARSSSTSGSSARCRSTTSMPAATPTTTAGCSIACASRPPPSSTTRSCSSRRRKIRSPIRSPACRTRDSCSCTSRASWRAPSG